MRVPRIGVVLGGGGVIGNAYLTGALEAIRRVTGWDPGSAEVTIGTSAGSVNGALSALGIPCDLMFRYVCGEQPDAEELSTLSPAAARFHGHPDHEWTDRLYPRTGVLPRPFLSSPRAVAQALLPPWKTPLELFVAGLIGEGFVSTRTIGELIELVCPSGWSEREYWAVAVDLEDGRRVAFGRSDAPETDVSRAVRASCAIPAFFAPVRVKGRRYIDGGVWSVSNLDLLAGRDLDLVVCVNPMSTLEGRSYEGPVDRITGVIHRFEERAWRRFGRRLGWERRRVERHGTPVLLIQPTAADLEVIPVNLMDASQRRAVAERTLETTIAGLETRDDWLRSVRLLHAAAEAI
ncbi:MAG: patatin-like phospholipase family protein [Deltaproteobacteria bacterium]|nr:patatin-like phospholipase family protein [Deltaproteobacteria bacterium]MBW2393977.1 patatin-like phospholipase family protein [Deltaproteobacteria bacterium]